MSCSPFPGRPTRRVLIALALAAVAPARAQYPGGAVVQPLPSADDPAEKLAAALRTLAVSPHDLAALIEAGHDALTLGDPNAAVGFFGRADEVSPRDGRVKAGLGAALVQLEKPRDALRYFEEASALGVPDVDLAEDRGLAYDLVGDPARAQRDYQTVLAAYPGDDAARRRLALSQGISGNRAAAIATLDPLIRKRDIAAWRAQTFVLAMTGDAKGANDITRIMLPQQQAMLQPFLERLATLSPGDKARAVHFGEMPAAGRSYSGTQLASIGTPATYAPAPVKVAPPPRAVPPPVVSHAAPAPAVTPPVAAVAAAPSPAPRPVHAPAAPPAASGAGRERFVSSDGTPMRRIEHSPQEMMALGLPRYEYVPLAETSAPHVASAAAPVTVATATPLAAKAPEAASPSSVIAPGEAAAPAAPAPAPLATVATAASPPTVETAPPPVATSPPPPVSLASAGPAPTVATVAPTPTVVGAVPASVVPIPPGASNAEGHFDVPHESADRLPIPRLAQPSARPPVTAAAAPAEPVTRVVEAAPSANPTVAVARRAHADSEIASADRPVRVTHTRSVAAEEAAGEPARKADADKPKDSDGDKARHAERGRAARTGDEDETASDHKGRHDQHTRTASRDEDAGDSAPAKRHGKGKPDEKARPEDKVRHGEDRGAGKKGERDADKSDKSAPGGKVYVQVAGGANREDMDKAWAGVKARAPDLMKGHSPSTTPLKATNRLLVGPFKSEDEAQAFVNKMAGRGLSGFTFKSAKGQKVDKIDTGK